MKTTFGEVTMSKVSPLCQCPNGFQISPLLQEHFCRIGSKLVFEEASEEMEEMLNIEVNPKQVERVCHCYGGLIGQIDWREAYSDSVQLKISFKKDENVYAMADGSMLLTREESWKEVKLGRVFTTSSLCEVSKGRGIIMDSVYTAHLGNASEFWERFSKEIPSTKNLVFIADGSKWIWNYINGQYPSSIQILDFYHCKEHICHFAKECTGKNEGDKKAFIDMVIDKLFGKDIEGAISLIDQVKCTTKVGETEKGKLVNYLKENKGRINYGDFISKGLLIGSGPIEASHRDIIQKRLKLSGQRWTIKGAQQIANLRIYKNSNRWQNVVSLITDYKKVA